MDGPQVFLACVVGAASPSEPSDNGVDDLSAFTGVGLWGVVSPSVSTSIAFSRSRGGSVPSPRSLFFARGTTCFSGTTYEASEVSGLNELFYLVFQSLAFLGGVADILMVPAPFTAVSIL